MKKIFLLFLFVIAAVAACGENNKKDHSEGDAYMKWEDEYFMQICSQVFNKPGTEITYDDVSSVEKIAFIGVNGAGKVSVSLLSDEEAKIVDRPDAPMKNLADLAYFTNLNYLETYSSNFEGIKILKNMPQLKTLIVWGEKIKTGTLNKIAEYSCLESLTIPFLDIDYSCLSKMPTLKKLTVTPSYFNKPKDYSVLQTLPSEGCLLDLNFINEVCLTPELYTLFDTHPNISKIGRLTIPDGGDTSFFKHMKYLEKVNLWGGNLDLIGISQMTWLKDLRIKGRNIDISQLSNLTNLECLYLSESGGEDEIGIPLSIDTLGNYKNLRELSLSGYMVESLKGLEAFPDLRLFDCESCLVEDISALKSLRHMEHLDLDNNLIKDISSLQSMNELKHLSLGSNEISDISYLKKCNNLEYLDLNRNYITDISALANMQKLEELRIEVNFHVEGLDFRLVSWRHTLLSLPNLKYYAGGPYVDEWGKYDTDWISQNLPNVKIGYSDVG